MIPNLKLLAFDADDTLWVNEPLYLEVEHAVEDILRPYLPQPNLKAELYEREKINLTIFGYGAKGFVLSLIETAIELTNNRISAADIHNIIALGKDMLSRPIELLPNVAHVLHELEERFPLMLLTKGDLLDQESKLARSGLARYFTHVEIVSEKKPETYQEILRRHGVDAQHFLMVGNSLRSDVLPVVEIGGHGIYVPFETTWQHEQVSEQEQQQATYLSMKTLSEVLEYLHPEHS